MTATDTLRALLDERGVEWGNCIGPFPQTAYNVGNVVWQVKELVAGLDVSTRYLTPEETVEATLGRGTCKVEGHGMTVCDDIEFHWYSLSCGHKLRTLWEADTVGMYCPNCGRKVVE